MNAEKYFKTRNLYEILEVSSDAEIQEGKNLFWNNAVLLNE